MKNIKTYEGFFDFLKKKKNLEPVYLEDIKECLYDITEDEPRIKNSLDGNVDGIFKSYDEIFGIKNGRSIEYYGSMDHIKDNMIAVRLTYNLNEISNEEVKRLLEICSSKLRTYDCVATFYLSYGRDEGRTDDKEYKSVDKLFNAINKYYSWSVRQRNPNIAMKITAPSKIIV
jgi:hypothetical protein